MRSAATRTFNGRPTPTTRHTLALRASETRFANDGRVVRCLWRRPAPFQLLAAVFRPSHVPHEDRVQVVDLVTKGHVLAMYTVRWTARPIHPYTPTSNRSHTLAADAYKGRKLENNELLKDIRLSSSPEVSSEDLFVNDSGVPQMR